MLALVDLARLLQCTTESATGSGPHSDLPDAPHFPDLLGKVIVKHALVQT
jgi:hypothetical protein